MTFFEYIDKNRFVSYAILALLFAVFLLLVFIVVRGDTETSIGPAGFTIKPSNTIELPAPEKKIPPAGSITDLSPDQPLPAPPKKEIERPRQSKPISPRRTVNKPSPPPATKTEVKMGDTSILITNQPSNINLGDNSVVGNNINSTITINPIEPKQKLTKEEEIKLVKDLNAEFRNVKRTNTSCVAVSAANTHPKAIELKNYIDSFLLSEGYNVVPNIVSHIIGGGARKEGGPEKAIHLETQEGECTQITVYFF